MPFHDSDEDYDPDAELDAIAASHGVERDYLGQFEDAYQGTTPFRAWWHKEIQTQNLEPRSKRLYESHIERWMDWMDEQGRHPALPSQQHVRGYIEMLQDRGLRPTTIRGYLKPVVRAFDFFAQEDGMEAHQPDANIIRHVRNQMDLSGDESKEYPALTLSEVREFVQDIDHIRHQLVVLVQLKLGLRAGEVANIRLSDIHLGTGVHDHFAALGEDVDHEQAIYIPSDREGTKATNDRTLPLDEELRQAMTRYLLIRPDTGDPHLFLSLSDHEPLTKKGVMYVWENHVRPKYPETDDHKAVTSHFGRHWFTDFWAVEQDLNRHLVQYMRGDAINGGGDTRSEGIDHYLHPEYSDIEDVYRKRVYTLL